MENNNRKKRLWAIALFMIILTLPTVFSEVLWLDEHTSATGGYNLFVASRNMVGSRFLANDTVTTTNMTIRLLGGTCSGGNNQMKMFIYGDSANSVDTSNIIGNTNITASGIVAGNNTFPMVADLVASTYYWIGVETDYTSDSCGVGTDTGANTLQVGDFRKGTTGSPYDTIEADSHIHASIYIEDQEEAAVNPSGLTISAQNLFDASSLPDFNVTISNSSYSATVESNFSTGQTFFENITIGNYTVNVSNSQFFNLSYSIELLEVNATITSNLTQAYVLIEAFETLSDQRINAFNSSIGGQSNETINGTSFMAGAGGSHTLNWNSYGYWSESATVTYTNLSYNYYRFNVTKTKLNVTALVAGSGSTINSFTINLSRIDTDFTQEEINITTDGVAAFNVENGTYNISIVADGYAFESQSLVLAAGQTFYQLNISLLSTNTFNISFYDEVDKTLLDSVTSTLELISDSFSGNYSTTNGTLLLDLLTPETYVIRFSGNPDYPERFSYFELTNGTYNNVDLYLLNTTSSTDVVATVFDENNQPVEDAQIKTYRYDIVSNSYLLQEIISTNFEGKATMGLELDTEYYKFTISYNGVLKLTTSPSYVTETALTFGIIIAAPAGEQYFTYLGVTHENYFNNATENFVFVYDDGSNTASQGCLYVYEIRPATKTLINSSCASTASGTIVLGIDSSTGKTYRSDGYVTLEGVNNYMGSAHATFRSSYPFEQSEGLLVWFLFIVFVFVGIYSLTLALILAPLPILMGAYSGLLNLPVWVATGIFVLSLILAAIVSRRN